MLRFAMANECVLQMLGLTHITTQAALFLSLESILSKIELNFQDQLSEKM
jgi:hypothetical protein